MNVLIVEDEQPAARQLARLLREIDVEMDITGQTDSVAGTLSWLQQNVLPDLIFMDIQLSDDLSFAIFEQTQINCPVIFTTAYDEYALQAFKVNSIDYLLKPVDPEELKKSLEKLETIRQQNQKPFSSEFTQELAKNILHHKPIFKNRFLVKRGEQYLSIPVDDILYFVSEHKITYCITKEQLKFSIDHTLEELENLLDPQKFFRVNRQCMLQFDAIEKIHSYFNGKLLVTLQSRFDNEFTISKEKAMHFKSWLNQ
jgi:DNA-binding LytR/AlgR family response regulator